MLFAKRFWPGIEAGSITLTFRRWRRRQVVAGRRYRTPVGFIEVDSIDEVDPRSITSADARHAGFSSADALRAELRHDEAMPVYRIRFHHVDLPDPRHQLAARAELTTEELAELDRRLARLDRVSRPWTQPVLRLTADQPGVRAADLAAAVGQERDDFKRRVRRLKQLGLTISLSRGYELSPRGRAYLQATRRSPG